MLLKIINYVRHLHGAMTTTRHQLITLTELMVTILEQSKCINKRTIEILDAISGTLRLRLRNIAKENCYVIPKLLIEDDTLESIDSLIMYHAIDKKICRVDVLNYEVSDWVVVSDTTLELITQSLPLIKDAVEQCATSGFRINDISNTVKKLSLPLILSTVERVEKIAKREGLLDNYYTKTELYESIASLSGHGCNN